MQQRTWLIWINLLAVLCALCSLNMKVAATYIPNNTESVDIDGAVYEGQPSEAAPLPIVAYENGWYDGNLEEDWNAENTSEYEEDGPPTYVSEPEASEPEEPERPDPEDPPEESSEPEAPEDISGPEEPPEPSEPDPLPEIPEEEELPTDAQEFNGAELAEIRDTLNGIYTCITLCMSCGVVALVIRAMRPLFYG